MGEQQPIVSFRACFAEFVAMALFVVVGCGSAMGIDGKRNGSDTSSLPGWVLLVSLSFGLAITTLAYMVGHHSGGHINCAVTLGLVLSGQCALVQGLANFVAQTMGSIWGACILCAIYPDAKDHTGGLGSNGLASGWSWHNALFGEVVGTFLLMTVVLQTACSMKSERSRPQAAIAIGIAVFVAHAILIPIDGCSINPTRSLGPAIVAHFRYAESETDFFADMWIFWMGPLIGASLATLCYKGMDLLENVQGQVNILSCAAEFMGMLLFVVFGCGSAMGIEGSRVGNDTSTLPAWVLLVALVFGLAITTLAYSIGHHSGGHINCAVTLGLVLAGKCDILQGIANFAAQMGGSVAGAGALCLIYPVAMDGTAGLGANGVADGWEWYNVLVGEIIGTFLLMQVVLQTACHSQAEQNRPLAALAIGLAVFLAHAVLIPIDGCSINPTRSFGPALIAHFRYSGSRFDSMWLFWLGPCVGAVLASVMYRGSEEKNVPVGLSDADTRAAKNHATILSAMSAQSEGFEAEQTSVTENQKIVVTV